MLFNSKRFGLLLVSLRRSLRPYSSKPPKTSKYNSSLGNTHLNGSVVSSSSNTQQRSLKDNRKKYISFKDFPKAPESVLMQSTEELFSNINMEPKNKIKEVRNDRLVDFTIPEKYLTAPTADNITEKDRLVAEEINNLLKSDEGVDLSSLNLVRWYYEQENNQLQSLPEHPLKKSLSGMINLNPILNNISDQYLWELFPRGKSFGVPPFEPEITKNGFKNWEKSQLDEIRKIENKYQTDDEIADFKALWHKSRTFYKATPNGRRKLDRKLLRKYKKLKQAGKLPREFVLTDLNLKNENIS